MNTQNRTYRCFRCGKRFTKYGRQAEILDDVEALLAEYRILINDPKAKKLKYTCLEMVEVEAKCCKDPFILHTYPEKEDRL
jgi:DNA-directed RNA polymerase subunit RPC12/RpoP